MSKIEKAELIANLTFSLLAKCQEKENRLAEQHGLFQVEFRCLRLLGLDEKLNNKALAKRMDLSPSRITRVIDGLVKKGFMIRVIDKDDRRNVVVSLSRRGKNLSNKLYSAFIRIHSEILEEINVSQHKSLTKAMSSLNSAMEKWL
jgi:DNA-binding MarR family transcriptional regulator